MIRWGVLLVTLGLAACSFGTEEFGVDIASEPRSAKPAFVVLKNNASHQVGVATGVGENIFLTADHFFREHEDLFYQDSPVKILARDFEHNALFVALGQWYGGTSFLVDQPPILGQSLRWFDGKDFQQAKVASVGDKERGWFSLVTDQTSYLAGGPIFDAEGRVYGVFLKADQEKGLLHGLRSDVILRFIEDLELD